MAQINKIYTFTTMPGIDPDIGLKIDQEIAQIINTVNSLDDANIDGNPKIAESKINLSSGGYLPSTGGDLTNTLWHKFSSLWRKMGIDTGSTGRIYEYRDLSNGILWGIAYNTYYNSGWQARDVADICFRLEISIANSGSLAVGSVRAYFAPYAGSGAPVWNPVQHYAPMGGYSKYHNGTAWSPEFTESEVTTITNNSVSGIFHYNKLTLNGTWTLEQGKPLIIIARDTVTINGTIDGNGKGANYGNFGDGINGGLPGNSGMAGGAGGGGGGGSPSPDTAYAGGTGGSGYNYGVASGGGAGGNGNNNGSSGSPQAITKLTDIPNGTSVLGGGGGGGGGSNGSSGRGGYGGGFIFIVAPVIILNSGSIIRCNGEAGLTGNLGGGGGGGGGVIVMRGKSIINSASITVSAGSGGTGTSYGDGGAGGAGVIFIEELR